MEDCILNLPAYLRIYIGLFISPSGISNLCGTVTGTVMPKGTMSTEGEILFVLPYRCSICPPLVTWQMSNLAILANSNTHNASLFPVHAMFSHDCPLAVKPASMPRRLVHKKKLGEILYLLMCCSLLCLSWLLCSRVRKFRRDLWITLYMCVCVILQTALMQISKYMVPLLPGGIPAHICSWLQKAINTKCALSCTAVLFLFSHLCHQNLQASINIIKAFRLWRFLIIE
jgi:hypothetical protein